MDNGLYAWETNAVFWDDYMGDESNYFHRDLVRPHTEELLDVKEGDFVLDIACGNGNFSKRLDIILLIALINVKQLQDNLLYVINLCLN